MQGKTILRVEDNPDDDALARRASKQNNIANTIAVARDGQEPLIGPEGAQDFEPVVRSRRGEGFALGGNSGNFKSSSATSDFIEAVRQLGRHWLPLNQAAPQGRGK